MPEMKPSEVIRAARNIMFERGWARGAWQDQHGGVCVNAAVNIAQGEPIRKTVERPLFGIMCYAAEAVTGELILAANNFNDNYAESFDDIVAFWDKAEKIAEEREAGQ